MITLCIKYRLQQDLRRELLLIFYSYIYMAARVFLPCKIHLSLHSRGCLCLWLAQTPSNFISRVWPQRFGDPPFKKRHMRFVASFSFVLDFIFKPDLVGICHESCKLFIYVIHITSLCVCVCVSGAFIYWRVGMESSMLNYIIQGL